MPELSFFVPGTPQTAGSKVPVTAKNGKAYVIEAGTKKSRAAKAVWRADLREAATRAVEQFAGKWPTSQAVGVLFSFFRARPASHFGRKGGEAYVKPSADRHPIQRPDALKLARAAEDALTGILWEDDSQIVVERLFKRWADAPSERVGLLVQVWTID